jgi:hypothetical protein
VRNKLDLVKMKGIFWNCNGLVDSKKHRFLSDLVKEKESDFVALSESGRSDFTTNFLNNLCGGKDYLWHCIPPKGRSGGMLVGVELSIFGIGEIEEGDFLSNLN